MTDIREFVMSEPLFETHNHQRGFSEHDWETKTWRELLGYADADVHVAAGMLNAQTQPLAPLGPDSNFGPYNATFLQGGVGLSSPLSSASPVLRPGALATSFLAGWLADRINLGWLIAAIVSGIAGLMLSVNSHLGAEQLRARLRVRPQG